MSVHDTVMDSSDGVFSDYQVSRDGKKDGAVFEYTYAENVEVDRSKLTPDIIKNQMIAAFSDNAEAEKCLGLGIYTRFIYKTYEGEVLCDVTITADDL